MGEWVKKMWYIEPRNGMLYSQKKEIVPFAKTWMHLEDIMLFEISQTEREILYDLTFMWKKPNSEIED